MYIVTDERYERINASSLLKAGGQKINFTEKKIAKELEMLDVKKVEAHMAFPHFCLRKLRKLYPNRLKVCSTILEGYTMFPVLGSMVWSHQSSKMVIKVK